MKSKRFPVGSGGRRHPERIEQKREEAHTRNTLWAQLTTAEKLRELDRRLGAGVGAKRQRARIVGKAAA
jgi:hypothetical protein